MDIANIFNYEQTFTLDLVNPKTGDEIGVSFEIRSASSDEAKAVQRKQLNNILTTRQKGRHISASDAEKQQLEEAASFVAAWDWGGNDYDGQKLECTYANVCKVLKEQRWINTQVVEAANDLGNFTANSEKRSAKQSTK